MSAGHKQVLGDLTTRLTERFAAVDAGEQTLAPAPPRAKSAPGHLLDLSGANQKIADLQASLKEHEGSIATLRATLELHEGSHPTRLLDPTDIVLSRFSNRHPDSYRDAEYVALRKEIEAAGGNTQPIGVRPMKGQPGKYELSFGSRRRQACLDLGLPVLAMIEEMDDVQLFEHMERENRDRKNLRPYEQGVLYKQALEAKLYPSIRRLAEALQIDATGLSRVLAVAGLPQDVVDAFASPLEIQAKWGPSLTEALSRNQAAVLSKAAELKAVSPRRSAHQVLHELLAAAGTTRAPAAPRADRLELQGGDGQKVTITYRKNAATIVVENIAPIQRAALEKALRKYLS
jgi:ParB family transcriptional regulator, chromosome partitioning protein